MEPSDTRGITLAIDIGGTFTDAVLEVGGQRHAAKVLTTSPDPDRGFLESAHQVLKRASLAASDVGLIIHGTTLATNAIIERKGARVALICTEGMRDSLEMAYEHRFEQSDLFMERPVPLVPRHLRLPVRERLAADGSVLIPLDEASVERLVPVLEDAGVESVAIEEQAQTLVRTAFSTSTREAGDVSAGIFDLKGQMLAQAVTGTPGHINSMALSVGHFLERFPVATMGEGDCYLTNDPWKGTGLLNDFTVVSPSHRKGKLVALFACTSHMVDIGGLRMSPDGRQIYHEGLFVPIMPFATAGVVNEWLLELVRANVREPVQVQGDLYALAACNETGGRRIIEMMDETGIDDLDELGAFIIGCTSRAMRESINRLPKGTVSNRMTIDGFDRPIDCPKCYTDAYTSFGVKCVVGPKLPNNAGSLAPIKIVAPENTIINAPHPCAVVARSTVGHMLPDLVFGCLHQIVPGQVPAEGTSCLWNLKLGAGPGMTSRTTHTGQPPTAFMVMSFHSGGAGARPTLDGLSATPFPSGVKNVPIEVTEAISPLVIWKKEYRQDSGGPGKFRGGLGQTMVVGNREGAEFAIFATYDRVTHPPRGREGGANGMAGRVSLGSGAAMKGMGRQIIPAGDRVVIEMPGGGGYGNPAERDIERIREDVRSELVSREAAERDYGIAVNGAGVYGKAGTGTRDPAP